MLTETVIPYCERLTSGAEIYNVASNLAFVLPFLYGIHKLRTAALSKPPDTLTGWRLKLILVVLTAAIGCGSALFHHAPSHLTHMLDVIPIIAFALLTTILVLQSSPHRLMIKISVVVLWIAASAVATAWPEILAHSLFYLPTVALLAALASMIKTQGGDLIILTLLFASALTARALDLILCDATGIGTHIIWHFAAALSALLCLKIVFQSDSHCSSPALSNRT